MLLAKAEWGTIPDWVTAFGTLAAFAVALRLLAKELAARREYEQGSGVLVVARCCLDGWFAVVSRSRPVWRVWV